MLELTQWSPIGQHVKSSGAGDPSIPTIWVPLARHLEPAGQQNAAEMYWAVETLRVRKLLTTIAAKYGA